MQGGGHAILQFQEPLLHLAPGFGRGNDVQQLHHLALTALHVGDVQHISEHHTGDAFKALLQMGLHSGGEEGQNSESLLIVIGNPKSVCVGEEGGMKMLT